MSPKETNNDGAGDAGDGGDGSGDSGGGGGAVTIDEVERVAEDVATRVLEKLLGDDAGGDGGDGGKGDGATGPAASARQTETNVAAEVAAELRRIKAADDELDTRIGAKIAEKIVEAPPEKLGRVARFMWGGDK